jgi:hypothetical protein
MLDRCEAPACNAEAKVRVVSQRSSLDLLFCGHHYRDHESDLEIQGFHITDDIRDMDSVRPGASNAED